MCNYQGEIFAINGAEFKISALLNLKIIESIMHIIFGKTLSIFEKNETYRPAYYFSLLLRRYFTKMPRNLPDCKAVKMSN